MIEKILKESLIELLNDGLNGNQKSFEMRIRKLSGKLNKYDPQLAEELSSMLKTKALRGIDNHIPMPVDADTRQKLLLVEESVALHVEPIWNEKIENEINRICIEREKSDSLLKQGLIPTRSVLLAGPPGVGKTLMAHYLAEKLKLPLLTLDLATVMSSYLGKTGSNIRAVLNYAKSFPCILFFDEFDAIAKKRDDDSDVGELKRLVTVLLQAIDEWPTTSLLLAATNHSELLDRAIWRRFDKVILFNLPEMNQVSKFFKQHDINHSLSDWLAQKIQECSFSEIEKKLNHAKKNAVLENKLLIETLCDQFDLELKEYFSLNKESKKEWIMYLANHGLTQQDIANKLEVSRSTIVRALQNKK